MMGGDDNITQNVDRNERERERDKDEGRGRMQASGGTAWSVCSSSDYRSYFSLVMDKFETNLTDGSQNKIYTN